MSSSDSTLGASSKRPVLSGWLILVVVLYGWLSLRTFSGTPWRASTSSAFAPSLCHEESEGRQCLTPPMPPLVVELSCRDIMRGDYILQSARRSGHNLLGVSTKAHR